MQTRQLAVGHRPRASDGRLEAALVACPLPTQQLSRDSRGFQNLTDSRGQSSMTLYEVDPLQLPGPAPTPQPTYSARNISTLRSRVQPSSSLPVASSSPREDDSMARSDMPRFSKKAATIPARR